MLITFCLSTGRSCQSVNCVCSSTLPAGSGKGDKEIQEDVPQVARHYAGNNDSIEVPSAQSAGAKPAVNALAEGIIENLRAAQNARGMLEAEIRLKAAQQDTDCRLMISCISEIDTRTEDVHLLQKVGHLLGASSLRLNSALPDVINSHLQGMNLKLCGLQRSNAPKQPHWGRVLYNTARYWGSWKVCLQTRIQTTSS